MKRSCGSRVCENMPPPRCASALHDFEVKSAEVKSANRAYFFTRGYSQFWGAGSHNEGLMRVVHSLVPKLRGQSVVDVGAGKYATVGGDISHLALYLQLWGCPSAGGLLFGFEPMPRPFEYLASFLNGSAPASMRATRSSPDRFELSQARRTCLVLSRLPLSDGAKRSVVIENMLFAGDNTASISAHYQSSNAQPEHLPERLRRRFGAAALERQRQRARARPHRPSRGRGPPEDAPGDADGRRRTATTTLDEMLAATGAPREVLMMKVDVEGHEREVLRGANRTMSEGRVHVLVLE